MNFTVLWRETALQQLARVWTDSDNRNGVTREVDLIDREVSEDPDEKGDDYFGDRYILMPILWALYRVVEDDRQVVALQVGRNGIDRPHDDEPASQ